MSKFYLLVTADKYEHVLYSTRKLIDIIKFMPSRNIDNKKRALSRLCSVRCRNSVTNSIFGKCKIVSLNLKIELEDIIYQYENQNENYLLNCFEIGEIAKYLGINRRTMYRYLAKNKINKLINSKINKILKEVNYGASMGQNE